MRAITMNLRMKIIERRIIHQVVSDALALGYRIGVWCDGLPVLSPTDNAASIMTALATGHEDHLHLYGSREGNHRWAWIRLAYGLGWDVARYHTSNIKGLVADVLETASRLEGCGDRGTASAKTRDSVAPLGSEYRGGSQ
jgi:hypothetical protein